MARPLLFSLIALLAGACASSLPEDARASWIVADWGSLPELSLGSDEDVAQAGSFKAKTSVRSVSWNSMAAGASPVWGSPAGHPLSSSFSRGRNLWPSSQDEIEFFSARGPLPVGLNVWVCRSTDFHGTSWETDGHVPPDIFPSIASQLHLQWSLSLTPSVLLHTLLVSCMREGEALLDGLAEGRVDYTMLGLQWSF